MVRLPEAALSLIQQHAKNNNRTSLCIVPNRRTAERLAQDIQFLWSCTFVNSAPPIVVFPPYKIRPGIISELERVVPAYRNRCQYLHIFSDPKPIIISTLGAFSVRCPSEQVFDRYFHQFSVGDSISISDLQKICEEMGYESQDLVDEVGTFATRGFVFDVYSAFEPGPVRLEFWGDQIEKIQTFNLHTQQTQSERDSFVLLAPKLFHYHQYLDLNVLESHLSKIPIPTKQKYEMIDALRSKKNFEGDEVIELACSDHFEYPSSFFKDAHFSVLGLDQCKKDYSAPYDLSLESDRLPISRTPYLKSFIDNYEKACESISFSNLAIAAHNSL